jgi:hypothetical protein
VCDPHDRISVEAALQHRFLAGAPAAPPAADARGRAEMFWVPELSGSHETAVAALAEATAGPEARAVDKGGAALLLSDSSEFLRIKSSALGASGKGSKGGTGTASQLSAGATLPSRTASGAGDDKRVAGAAAGDAPRAGSVLATIGFAQASAAKAAARAVALGHSTLRRTCSSASPGQAPTRCTQLPTQRARQA